MCLLYMICEFIAYKMKSSRCSFTLLYNCYKNLNNLPCLNLSFASSIFLDTSITHVFCLIRYLSV